MSKSPHCNCFTNAFDGTHHPECSAHPDAVPPSSPAQGSKTPRTAALRTVLRKVPFDITKYREMRLHAEILETENAALVADRDQWKRWYDEAMTASNKAGFGGVNAADTIDVLAGERDNLKKQNAALVTRLCKAPCECHLMRHGTTCWRCYALAASQEARP